MCGWSWLFNSVCKGLLLLRVGVRQVRSMLRINYCFVVIAVAALLPLSMRPDTFPIDLRDAVDARSVMSHLVVFLRVAILSPIGTLTHTLERSRQHSMTLVDSLIACSHLSLI